MVKDNIWMILGKFVALGNFTGKNDTYEHTHKILYNTAGKKSHSPLPSMHILVLFHQVLMLHMELDANLV